MRPETWRSPGRLLALNIALAGGLLLGMAAIMWQQPLVADDWDFYLAIVDWQHSRQLIPHPQTYNHLVQLSLAILGVSPQNARVVGVLSGLLNLALIPVLVRQFFGHEDKTKWVTVAIAAIWLYTLNPLTAQNMMMLDIDNTLLTPALCAMLWLWKRIQDATPIRRTVALGLAFAAALWIKIPTPILLMGCIGLFHLLRGQFKRAGEIALAAAGGAALFRASFELYGMLTGYTWAMLGGTFAKAPRSASAIPAMLQRFPQGMGVLILWLSLPLTALLIVLSFETLVRLVKRRLQAHDLLVVYVAVTALVYMLILAPAWGYPKYHTPLTPIIVILAARLLAPAFQALPKRAWWLVAGLGLGLFVYKLAIIGDGFYPLYQVTFETDVGDLALRLSRGLRVGAGLALPILAALAAAYVAALRWKIAPALMIVATLGALSAGDMASTSAVQVPADYSTRYRYTYDYRDLRQTVADLQAAGGGYILAVMDVLYYEGLSGERIYTYVCPGCKPQRLIDALQSRRIDALVWTSKEDNRSPGVVRDPVLVEMLNKCYNRSTHGVFILYLRKSECLYGTQINTDLTD
ncbi:MAG: glycosyltransferase family 39 protein [Thermoflexales bacterium]|nr:glycosyltransferase family 39 protein [Thermoflexales bacterium]